MLGPKIWSQTSRSLDSDAGAELANVLNEGALVAVRRGADVITQADIYDGVDRILQARPASACVACTAYSPWQPCKQLSGKALLRRLHVYVVTCCLSCVSVCSGLHLSAAHCVASGLMAHRAS